MNKEKDIKKFKILLNILAVIMLWIIVWIIIFKMNNKEIMNNRYNQYLNEFSIYDRLIYQLTKIHRGTISIIVRDLVLNALIFIPLGMVLSLYNINNSNKYKSLLFILLFSLLLSIFFETFQVITGIGWFDYNDIIGNTLGAVAGGSFFIYIFKNKNFTLINKLLIVLIVILFPLYIYSIVNTIINIDLYRPFFK